MHHQSLQMLRAATQETADVINIHKVCELQVPPSSRSHGLQMVMLIINEDAKQGGAEWAALSEPNGWTLAMATLAVDPHEQQRAICAPPSAMVSFRKAATRPDHRLISGPQNKRSKFILMDSSI